MITRFAALLLVLVQVVQADDQRPVLFSFPVKLGGKVRVLAAAPMR